MNVQILMEEEPNFSNIKLSKQLPHNPLSTVCQTGYMSKRSTLSQHLTCRQGGTILSETLILTKRKKRIKSLSEELILIYDGYFVSKAYIHSHWRHFVIFK